MTSDEERKESERKYKREYMREYYKRPGNKERKNAVRREKRKTSEGKAAMDAFNASPEAKAAQKKYSKTQKAKDRLRKYWDKPESILRVKEYNATQEATARRKRYAKTKAGKESMRAGAARYRARKAEAILVVLYTPEEIRQRDKDICYICGANCIAGAPKGEPLQLCLDHILPISKKGPDCPRNVSVACNKCNVRKHAKMPTRNFLLKHFGHDPYRLQFLLDMREFLLNQKETMPC